MHQRSVQGHRRSLTDSLRCWPGSYGAAPQCVLAAQDDFRTAQNANPDLWLGEKLPPLMEAARAAVAGLCGGSPENYCMVDNATTGASTVALMVARRFMSGEYKPGDVILVHRWMYDSAFKAFHEVCEVLEQLDAHV